MSSFARSTLAILCAAVAGAGGATEVKYMLWDSVQAPAYRQCAADFTRSNPGITVRITQSGWEDYWTAISMGFISETAPDVFVNHLSKSSEFVRNDLLVDLMPYLRRDGLDLGLYPAGLVAVWSRAGRQYGLPKDLDTIGLIVNLAHARKAGVTLAELQDMRWNPKDGGSFEQTVRKLTFDTSGRSAASAGFDPRKVAVYGYQTPGTGGMVGQTEWSHFAVSNGFSYQDRPWAKFHYDDPRLAETIDWLAALPGKGLSASYQNTRSMGADAMFIAGRAAMVPQGSWMITYFAANAKFENAWVPLPKGPSGRRASMLNGVADSIWVGSKVKDEAWKWVKYLASPACQGVVAGYGVTFPAIHGMPEKAVAAVKQKTGVDASAFLLMAKEQTFLPPIAENAAQADELMKGALESVFLGKQQAGPALKQANDKIDQLFNRAARRRSSGR